jgi:hypothetical protein
MKTYDIFGYHITISKKQNIVLETVSSPLPKEEIQITFKQKKSLTDWATSLLEDSKDIEDDFFRIKINLIKMARENFEWSLGDAKQIVESVMGYSYNNPSALVNKFIINKLTKK